ncbi:MAG: ATP-binding protein [Desulfuromonadales bacterium]|nr:ATP-binding protein [Desulfuromonadales bacterium]
MYAWLIEIIHNLAMLLSLVLLYSLLRQWLPRTMRQGNVLFGVLCGGVGILCMATAFVYQPGVVLDSRTVVMAISGLFGGGTGGLIAMAIAGGYRWVVAGPGLWVGLATILAAGTIGILGRRLISRANWPPTPWQLWATGLIAHLLAFICLGFLPEPMHMQVLGNMAVPFLGIYPLVVVVFGTIMGKGEVWAFSLSRLTHAEWLFNEAQKLTRFGSWEYRLNSDRLTATPYLHELLSLPADTSPLSLQDFFNRLHQGDWDAVRLAFDAAIDGKSEIDVQGRLVKDDGRLLWVRVVGKPIVEKGKVTQLVGNLIDITRRKTSELELRANEEQLQTLTEELTAKNDELERFTYSVSHDLKAPLLTIGSYSELLHEDFAANDQGLVAEDLGHIRAAVDKMRQLIDDLLDLSKIGQTISESTPVDLNQVVIETQLLLAGDLRRSGASIVTAPDLPTVWGNALRLRQVMQNLLQNALKFGDPDRLLRIDIGWSLEPGGSLLITVSDNGCGIAPEVLPRIFDLFAHGPGQGAGSGVGLALVRRIMEMHGGEVWAEPAGPNTGSTFFLRFPPGPTPPAGFFSEGAQPEYTL